MQPQLDPQALNLAKAIRRAETGGHADPYNARGASGETGAYQFMPETWKQWAGQYLQNSAADYSVENQNRVAYSRIKELKDQGLNPAQIASMWNSGKAEAYKEGLKGTNKQGVEFDVPAYVAKVSQHYNELKGGGQVAVPPLYQGGQTQMAPLSQMQGSTQPPTLEETGQRLQAKKNLVVKDPTQAETRLSQGFEALGKLSEGAAELDAPKFVSGVLQTGGAAAGGVVDTTDYLLGKIPGYDATMDFVGKKVIAPLFKGAGGDKAVELWQEYATKYPEGAKNIAALGNIASVIPLVKPVRTGVGLVGDTIRAGAAKSGFVKTVEQSAKAELRASGASAPSKAGQVLTATNIKGKMVDPVDTIVDGDYLPDVVNRPDGIPEYNSQAAIRRLDDGLELDEQNLQSMLEDASRQGLVGYVPMSYLRTQTDDLIKKAFADRGQVDAAMAKAGKIFDDFTKYKGDLVPLTELNNMKRGIREAVNFNSPKLSSDVRYQMGNLFMDKIEEVAERQGIKEIARINADMASKIRAKEALEFLDQRSVQERPGFRSMLGRRSGDVGTIAGEAIGQSMGVPGAGAAVGRTISNRAISGSGKSAIGKLRSKRARKLPSKLQTGAVLGVLQTRHLQENQSESKEQ